MQVKDFRHELDVVLLFFIVVLPSMTLYDCILYTLQGPLLMETNNHNGNVALAQCWQILFVLKISHYTVHVLFQLFIGRNCCYEMLCKTWSWRNSEIQKFMKSFPVEKLIHLSIKEYWYFQATNFKIPYQRCKFSHRFHSLLCMTEPWLWSNGLFTVEQNFLAVIHLPVIR